MEWRGRYSDCRNFTVETLYEEAGEEYWYLLDILLEDRTDLHERIAKYKAQHKHK